MESTMSLCLENIISALVTKKCERIVKAVLIVLGVALLYYACVSQSARLEIVNVGKGEQHLHQMPLPLMLQTAAMPKLIPNRPDVCLDLERSLAVESRDDMVFEEFPKPADIAAVPQIITADDVDSNITEATDGDIDNDNEHVIPQKIILNGNGGYPDTVELELESYLAGDFELPIPKRLGKKFDGWFKDWECTIPFTGITTEDSSFELYAGWKEYPGFISNNQGLISGYTDIEMIKLDGLLALPTHESCLGVTEHALVGLEEYVTEVYIPANITSLPDGIFDGFSELMYVEVAQGNPAFYSKFGIAYKNDGTEFCFPQGRNNW